MPTGIVITSYPQELEQVLNLLIQNAEVHGLSAIENGQIWIEAQESAESISLSVRDNGAGVDSAIAERIFDAFFTTRLGRNRGLGLNHAKNLVQGVLGGKITLEASLEPGAKFVLCLPKIASSP